MNVFVLNHQNSIANQFLLELVPLQKATKDFLKAILLFIDKKDFSVVNVKMIEPNDNVLVFFESGKPQVI